MNCTTPPSPPSPNLLYSGYPRSAGTGPPTTVSMASFSPSMSSPAGVTPTPYSHMHHTMSQLTPSYGAGCYQSSDLSHYGDMRSASTGWYSSPATDPRFASEYFSSLMRGPSSGMGGMAGNMGGLTGVPGCSMDPGKQQLQHSIQFPLSS